MNELFLKLVNMSITAGWIALAILLLRPLLQKCKFPKWITCLLWALVGIRLVLPVSFESIFSLIPSAQTLPGEILTGNSFDIQTGFDQVDNSINDYLGSHYYEGVTVPADTGVNLIGILSVIWVCGMAAMLVYTVLSYLRLYRRVRVSVQLRDNIYACDHIDTPFILGVFRPKIYLPSGMRQADTVHVIAHEQAHLKRHDHIIKPLGFLLLTVYWFHPVLWIAYLFLCRDIELACDEKVIAGMASADKKAYSEALLSCSMQNTLPRHLIAACPLAFGEVGVKKRIQSVLNHKKPAFWVMIAAVILCAVLSVCFLTNPPGMGIDDIEPKGIGDTATTVPGFDIEDRAWKMTSIIDGKNGDILACHPKHSGVFTEAEIVHMILTADGEILSMTNQTDQKTYDFLYRQIRIDPESYLYEIESKQTGKTGYATVAFTKYFDGSKVYTMVMSIGEYAINFSESTEDESFVGGSEQTKRIEVYYMDQPVLYDNPTLRLNLSDETFTFNYSTFSSYLAYGHFKVEDDTLICTTDDGNNVYQFDILGYANYNAFTGLRFDAEHSSRIPSYRYSSDATESICPVTDGAKFIYTEDAVMVTPADQLLAEIQLDIDGDGAKELCSLTLGLSQTSAWVPVTLTVSKLLDSYTYEVIYKETLRMGGTYVTMEENKDGYLSIYVWDKPLSDPDRAVYSVYDIFLQDGKFTIRQAISEPLKPE